MAFYSFGVQLFWPFSLMRPELAIIFIVDLVLLGFLAAPQLTRLRQAWRPQLTVAAQSALVAVGLYLSIAFTARQYALALLAKETGGAGFQYAFPEPLGAHRWRGVVKGPDDWRVFLVNTSKSTVEHKQTLNNDEWSPPARAAMETPFGVRLMTFFKAPVWRKEPSTAGGWTVSVHDLRFSTLTLPRPTPFKFEFDVAPKSADAKPRGVRVW